MLNQPEANPKLTFEQLQAIDVAEKKLANLHREIDISTKDLRVLSLDINKAIKERAYQEDLMAGLAPQIEEKKTVIAKLDTEIDTKSVELKTLHAGADEITLANTTKDKELKDREEKVAVKEKEQAENTTRLKHISDSLGNQIDEHNAKVAKLRGVIDTL